MTASLRPVNVGTLREAFGPWTLLQLQERTWKPFCTYIQKEAAEALQAEANGSCVAG